MNKYAAEKIAQDYYNLGIKLAMEKVSSNPSVLRKIIGEALNRSVQGASGVAGAGVGGAGGMLSGAFLSRLIGEDPHLLGDILAGAGATAGALKGLQSAPKVMNVPELYLKSPGLFSGGLKLR